MLLGKVARAVLLLGIGCAVSGCARLTRAGECRELAALVNPRLSAVEAATKANSAAGYRAAATLYTRLAAEIRGRKLGGRGGAAIVEEYAATFAAVAPAMQQYADALEGGASDAQNEARREISRATRREQGAIARITLYCQGR